MMWIAAIPLWIVFVVNMLLTIGSVLVMSQPDASGEKILACLGFMLVFAIAASLAAYFAVRIAS